LARAGPIVRALPRRAPPEGAGLGTTRARRQEAPRTGRSARRRSPRRERDPRGAFARIRRVACLQYDIKNDVMSSHPGIMLRSWATAEGAVRMRASRCELLWGSRR